MARLPQDTQFNTPQSTTPTNCLAIDPFGRHFDRLLLFGFDHHLDPVMGVSTEGIGVSDTKPLAWTDSMG